MRVTDSMLENEILMAENEKKMFEFTNSLKKQQIINGLKGGLGKEIKDKGGAVKIIKKPWYNKLFLGLKKFFTRF